MTFHIRDGMKWSDGTPATSKDVCFSWGLAMAAIKDDANIGSGYLDPGVKDAGVTKIECPDDSTFIAYTTDQSDRIYQVYVPILPEHVYGKLDYKKIADEKFDGPARRAPGRTRSPSGRPASSRASSATRTTGASRASRTRSCPALLPRQRRHDGPGPQVGRARLRPRRQPRPVQAARRPTRRTPRSSARPTAGRQLAFNTYGTGTGKTIKNGGPSTKALLDPAFRDALGYAVDHKTLVDRVLGGFGDVGTTIVPPVLGDLHVEPDHPRTFDIDLAKQKLDAAGYHLDANGKRLDKEGKPISLRLVYPNTSDTYSKSAQFVQEWYGQLGIDVTTQSLRQRHARRRWSCRRRPDPPGTAKYDIELWGWSRQPRSRTRCSRSSAATRSASGPTASTATRTTTSCTTSSRSSPARERQATLAQMQNMIYDQAPYDILFYDANLDVYRNDKFAGWQNMPSNGTPFFTYGPLDYTLLTDASAQPSATPEAPSAAAPSAGVRCQRRRADHGAQRRRRSTGDSTSSSGSNSTLLLVLAVVVVVIIVGGVLLSRRRAAAGGGEDE